ncbi:hypothetical protein [Streptomyces collinus]|uniref:DUF3800 domain-containing protein n=1 Tax=Streptomyces collinus (strain DSM 40733 / Tue 365) TaxID=1214242 RepID=S5VSK5_STRC3|nr:hypothetical protein [Streptomyces collinus]AGS73862.1 hypothetical protein B446_35518 [Streptomyces collinus Tu 365]
MRTAWLDESFREHETAGFYIIAATVLDPAVAGTARLTMRGLKGPRDTAKLHWNEMDRTERKDAAQTVAAQEGLHVVSVGSPVPRRKQERARSKCLSALIQELHGFGVSRLCLEAREDELNARDIRTIATVRQTVLPKGSMMRAEHIPGATEPLLWISDIVAGAVRAQRLGDSRYTDLLGETLIDFDVATDC